MNLDPSFAGRPRDTTGSSPGPLLIGWVIVYSLNLIVPLFFGSMATEKAGKLGMALAIPVPLLLGCWAFAILRDAGKAVIIGGLLIAACQVFPLPQIYAGTIGIAAARSMGQADHGPQISTDLGGFVATVVTGSVLIVVALVIGWMMRGITAWFRELKAEHRSSTKVRGIDFL